VEKRTYVLLDEHGEPVSINEVPVYKPEDLLLHLRTLKPILYSTVKVNLATARTGIDKEAFTLSGDFLMVQDISGAATAQIVFNEPKQDKISLVDRLAFHTPFYRFFIVNTAQVGETLTLILGRQSLFRMGTELSDASILTELASLETELATKVTRATTPVIYNVTMTLADTEYTQALPANTKKFSIRTRDGTAFRLAFETGKVAEPTEPYIDVLANLPYTEEQIEPATLTLYFGCGGAGKIAEIVAWS